MTPYTAAKPIICQQCNCVMYWTTAGGVGLCISCELSTSCTSSAHQDKAAATAR